jgi:hypothetical protein
MLPWGLRAGARWAGACARLAGGISIPRPRPLSRTLLRGRPDAHGGICRPPTTAVHDCLHEWYTNTRMVGWAGVADCVVPGTPRGRAGEAVLPSATAVHECCPRMVHEYTNGELGWGVGGGPAAGRRWVVGCEGRPRLPSTNGGLGGAVAHALGASPGWSGTYSCIRARFVDGILVPDSWTAWEHRLPAAGKSGRRAQGRQARTRRGCDAKTRRKAKARRWPAPRQREDAMTRDGAKMARPALNAPRGTIDCRQPGRYHWPSSCTRDTPAQRRVC